MQLGTNYSKGGINYVIRSIDNKRRRSYNMRMAIIEMEEGRMMEFSEKLRAARKETGLSQTSAGELFNPPIPYRTWQDWEAGRRTPPEWSWELILERLNRSKK